MKDFAGRLVLAALLPFCASAQSPALLQGQWKLSLGNTNDSELLLQFSVWRDGQVQGVFSIPAAHLEQAPITSVTWNGATVEVNIHNLGLEIRGTIDGAGTTIAGSIRKGDSTFPARLVLVTRTLREPVQPAPPAPREVVEWLRSRAIPLATAEPGHGIGDLRRLRDAIGDARIVAMGEATHGTREFFQLKHRMYYGAVRMAKRFDLLFFVERTAAARK